MQKKMKATNILFIVHRIKISISFILTNVFGALKQTKFSSSIKPCLHPILVFSKRTKILLLKMFNVDYP